MGLINSISRKLNGIHSRFLDSDDIEELEVRDRKVYVKFETDIPEQARQKFLDETMSIFKNDDLMCFGRKFEVVLASPSTVESFGNEGAAGWVGHEEVRNGELRIYVNTEEIMKDQDYFVENLVHEIEHLNQFYNTEILSQAMKISSRLESKANKNLKASLSSLESELNGSHSDVESVEKSFRSTIMYWLQDCLFEGLARYSEYCKKHSKDRILNEDNLEHQYARGETAAENVLESTDRFLSQPNSQQFENLEEVLHEEKYRLGYHMAFTIIFLEGSLTTEDLHDYSHLRFVKRYEKSCEELGLEPIITLNSGEGILDYNQIIQEWFSKFEIR